MKILVTVPMDDKERAIIEAAAPRAEFTYAAADNVTADMMADKEIIFGNVNAELLQCAKELKLMQLFTAGTDGYIGKLPEGCAITNTTGAFGLAISEHMLAMLLCLSVTVGSLESFVSLPIPVPGIKLGLANFINLFVLYYYQSLNH